MYQLDFLCKDVLVIFSWAKMTPGVRSSLVLWVALTTAVYIQPALSPLECVSWRRTARGPQGEYYDRSIDRATKILYLSRAYEQRDTINKYQHETQPLPCGRLSRACFWQNREAAKSCTWCSSTCGWGRLLPTACPHAHQTRLPEGRLSKAALGTPDFLCFSVCSEPLTSFLPGWKYLGMPLTKGLSTHDSWRGELISSWGSLHLAEKSYSSQDQLIIFRKLKKGNIQKNWKPNRTPFEYSER